MALYSLMAPWKSATRSALTWNIVTLRSAGGCAQAEVASQAAAASVKTFLRLQFMLSPLEGRLFRRKLDTAEYTPVLQTSIPFAGTPSRLSSSLYFLMLAVVRQSEHIQRVAVAGVMNLRRDHAGHVARASTAQPSGDGNVLFAADSERDRIALHGRAEARFPKHLSG